MPARRSKKASIGGRTASTTIVITVAMVAIANSPAPAAMPTAAFTQIVAAVVIPCTLVPLRMMAPAPRKPIP